jgi:hypothetical protein
MFTAYSNRKIPQLSWYRTKINFLCYCKGNYIFKSTVMWSHWKQNNTDHELCERKILQELDICWRPRVQKILSARLLGTKFLCCCPILVSIQYGNFFMSPFWHLRILRWLPDFWKICGPLSKTLKNLIIQVHGSSFHLHAGKRYYYYFQLRTAAFKAYCAILVRRSNFRHQASPCVSPCYSTQQQKVNCGQEMSGNFD